VAPNSFVNARLQAVFVGHTVNILYSTQFSYQIFVRKHWNMSKRTSGVDLRGQLLVFTSQNKAKSIEAVFWRFYLLIYYFIFLYRITTMAMYGLTFVSDNSLCKSKKS